MLVGNKVGFLEEVGKHHLVEYLETVLVGEVIEVVGLFPMMYV
jgi:hypothetical protein